MTLGPEDKTPVIRMITVKCTTDGCDTEWKIPPTQTDPVCPKCGELVTYVGDPPRGPSAT